MLIWWPSLLTVHTRTAIIKARIDTLCAQYSLEVGICDRVYHSEQNALRGSMKP